MADPDLVLLDEPTSGLDRSGRDDMLDLVARLGGEGVTVLMSTHLLADVERTCDHVVMLDAGRVVTQGATDTLLATTGLVTVEVDSGGDDLVAALRQRGYHAVVSVGMVEVSAPDNRLLWKELSKHPALGIPNRFGVPDVPERVHWDEDLARRVGTPGAYDYGPERASWLMHQITDWMGDEGFLVRHHSEIRRHNAEGDMLKIGGEVTGFAIDDHGNRCVEVTQEALTQHGDLSARAVGLVRLPSRN